MGNEFTNVDWSDKVAEAARGLVRLAIAEDFGDQCDWTSTSLVAETVEGSARLVTREAGVVAGLPIVPIVVEELAIDIKLAEAVADGTRVVAGESLGRLVGKSRHLLMAERTILNFLGRLSGIATLTREFVGAVEGTDARIYDTRKTTPGWRLLEKYAVRCGGGFNHRLGLHRGVMIKDNHVACAGEEGLDMPAALQRLRQHLAEKQVTLEAIEVEVDRLEQLEVVLPLKPDIVLLDNMGPPTLRAAVALRDRLAPEVVLEASGGISLATIREVAESGVDRISVGALTHSARALDVGLDWEVRAGGADRM
jgi:nicotinate-nucleotide pyrophosphorylase (carboxylating)